MNVPAVGAIVEHPPTFRVSELPSDTFPTMIVVFCDRCGVEHGEDVIVREADPPPVRFGYLRAHLRGLGWACDDRGDLCPECSRQAAEPPDAPG